MTGRDDRLRELLRGADPARDVAELGEAEAARLRRAVLAAANEERSRAIRLQPWVWAGAAALLALAIGLASRMTTLPTAPARTIEARSAPSAAPPQGAATNGDRRARGALPGAQDVGGLDRPAVASAIAAPDEHAHVDAAAPPTHLASRVAADNRSVPTRRRAARATPDAMPIDTHAQPGTTIAQTAAEPQPYQLQLTAPGGTRIVWVLTPSSGR